MATVSEWTPFGVSLDLTATTGTVTRISATQFTVVVNASWVTHYSGARTNYGMTASAGSGSVNLNTFGNKSSGGSGSFTGTLSVSGNGATSRNVSVTFRNYNSDNGDAATKSIVLTVSVPAWTSYTVSYNANGGSGKPGNQTKWKDQTLALSTLKPSRTGYTFSKWNTASGGTGTSYNPGGNYTANASATLYAQWTANTYKVRYDANGGSGAPGEQTKTHGVALTLSSTKPTRTNYVFKGWGTSASATTVSYAAGASYTNNAAITLYAIWGLAYEKPRINTVTLTRCTSDGTASDSGTYAYVSFTWSTDETVTSINVNWGSGSSNLSASGTSGTAAGVVGDGSLSAERGYDIVITVTDSGGSSTYTATLSSMLIPIDIHNSGSGVAIGKVAERANYFDIGLYTLFNNNAAFYNAVAFFNTVFVQGNTRFYKEVTFDEVTNFKKTATFNDAATFTNNIHMANAKMIYGKNTSGVDRSLVQLNASNQYVFGYGGYSNNEGASYFDGNSVNIRSKGAIAITSPTAGLDARHFGVCKTLWSGGYYMTENHTATLNDAVSAQPNGIVLVFSNYNSGAKDEHFNSYFVPKGLVAAHSGTGHAIPVWLHPANYVFTKYLYISDTSITGHSQNSDNRGQVNNTSGGGVFNVQGNRFVLRYVYGV